MIGSSKPLASLSATLLARKGTARPAMRPQGFGGFGAPPSAHDDLGWNDMGDSAPLEAPVPVVLVQREALHEEFAPIAPDAAVAVPAMPVIEAPVAEATVAEAAVEPEAPVVAQVAAPEPEPEPEAAVRRPVSVATATRIRRETNAKHVVRAKSAFTLRLDSDRHLKLRLASAMQNRSAQLLVTEALDAFLETLPEVAALVSQLPDRAKR